jgi:hypothetical protein
MHTFIRVTNTDADKTPYSVGYWEAGEWMPLRDCKTAAEAASWVSYLNGGKQPDGPW